jgi:HD-like signal output (HDOD) protein
MNQDIIKKIKLLPPLPESIDEIMRVCSDSESSLRELVDIVNKDPLAVATLLKVANSAIYGARRVHTIETAVGMFGKAIVRSFLVNSAVMNSFKVDLSPYGIDDSTYLKVAYERVFLVDRWYSSVSAENDISDFVLAVQLMSIGQVIVANEIIHLGKSQELLDAIEAREDLHVIEQELAGFTAIEATVEVLKHWKFDNTLIESIKHSISLDTIELADDDIKIRAVVNFVAFHSINEIGDIASEYSELICNLVDNYGLNLNIFEETLDEIRNL